MFTLYQFSRTWVDSSRIYAIRRQILMLKCTKFYFRWGSAPDPLARFKAPTSKGREAKMEGRGRKKWGPYYYERGKKEVDRREGRWGKGRGSDLPYHCQTASYAPVPCCQTLVRPAHSQNFPTWVRLDPMCHEVFLHLTSYGDGGSAVSLPSEVRGKAPATKFCQYNSRSRF